MILRLTLTDFMAHAATTIELAPGLNVLCGPNNTGKSAIVEALRCLCANPSPRHVIRHGATEARVEALLDDGWRVAWVRRKAHAIYEVYPPGVEEPQVFAKLGKGGVPTEVARLLRMGPVSFDKGVEVDVHLGDQRHPIFLLDQPGSLLADFLASSTESAHLMAMQDALRLKVRRAGGDSRRLEEGLAEVERSLDRLDPLPDVSLALSGLREEAALLEARRRAEPELAEGLRRMEAAGTRLAALRERLDVLAPLAKPPALAPASRLASAHGGLEALSGRVAAAKDVCERLAPLDAPPALAPAPPLALAIARLAALRAQREAASRRLATLSVLPQPPALSDAAPLAKLREDIATLHGRIANGKAWLAERRKELEALSARIAERLEQVGECPLCGSDLDAERFLGRRARG